MQTELTIALGLFAVWLGVMDWWWERRKRPASRTTFVDPDGPRPHGQHPTLGRCDCDECQLWDFMQRRHR